MAEIAEIKTQEELKEKKSVSYVVARVRGPAKTVCCQNVKIAFPNFANSSSISVFF